MAGASKARQSAFISILSLLLIACAGCGSGAPVSNPTPPLPTTISVSPSSALVSVLSTQQFTASGGAPVNWSVSGVSGGNSNFGTISSAGLYTAPNVASGIIQVKVTAALQSNSSIVATASVALVASGPISINPPSATVQISGTQQFTLVNASNNAVSWTVNHVAGGNSIIGTISSTGFYTAPVAIPSGLIDVTAISLADPSKIADAAVSLTNPAPTISSLSPNQITQPSPTSNATVAVTVTGTNFGPETSASLTVPGGTIALTINNSTTTSFGVAIPAGDLAAVGTYTVTVVNAAPGGGTASATLQVVSAGLLVMSTPRAFHTATLLPSGKVLIAGGQSNLPIVLSSAELYDPTTQSFTPTTSHMVTPRQVHTATLLPDGTVLLAGGYEVAGRTASAEIYDPTTDSFRSVGSMTTPRASHTATLLQSGKVLITGGTGIDVPAGATSPSVAELYDPSTKTFTATGSMSDEREGHTATLLHDGRVLIVGGAHGLGIDAMSLNTAEIYDPSSGTFASTASLAIGTALHTATLLANGQVLVAGGTEMHGHQYIPYTTAQLYDPTSATFLNPIQMVLGRVGHTATLLPDGTVRMIGGTNDPTTELFDPVRGGFAQSVSLSVARQYHTATLLPGGHAVLVTGGRYPEQLSSAELVQ